MATADGSIDLIKLNDLVAELDSESLGCLPQGTHPSVVASTLVPAPAARGAQLENVSLAMQELKQQAAMAALTDEPGTPAGAIQAPPNERAAADFLHIAREAGLRGLCDALSFCGLRSELPHLCAQGITVLAPTDAAFAQLAKGTRCNAGLVRQLLLAHFCSGISMLSDLQSKRTALALAGQTHAVNLEGGHTYVGTGRLSRTDLAFEGGVIHEVDSVLVVLHLVRDSHSEQVWKKTLQPAPCLCIVGGANLGAEYEVHGCLLHAATGQLVPDALRGHTRAIAPLPEEQSITFSEITVMAKPPSLAKRRGVQSDGTNRYRLLFSLWNSSTLSYVSWQHMSTPLVVRNSFHMLPVEEKNYRRLQYARTRSRGANPGTPGCDSEEKLMLMQPLEPSRMPSLPESEQLPHSTSARAAYMERDRWLPLSQARGLDKSITVVRRNTSFDTEGSSEQDDMNSVTGQMAGSGTDNESTVQHLRPEQELELLQNLAQHNAAASPREQPMPDATAPAIASVMDEHCEPGTPNGTKGRFSGDSGGSFRRSNGLEAPRLLDCSVREGTCSGGTIVWLHGENFSPEMVVFFGDVPVAMRCCWSQHIAKPSGRGTPRSLLRPVRAIDVISSQMLKCSTPEAEAQRRYQVTLQVVNPTSGARSSERLSFTYVPDKEQHLESQWQPELLERLLASLERAQLQVSATASAGATLTAEQLLRSLDEHGKSLYEYTRGLRRMLAFTVGYGGGSYREEQDNDASELQLGMADLARETIGDQLATKLAHRPDVEVLQQRNILHGPEADADKVAKRKRLEEGLMHRPEMTELQQRNIL